MTIKDQQRLRCARNQCPEHNGETFCILGPPTHKGSSAGDHMFLPAGTNYQAVYTDLGEWKTEMRVPEKVA